MSAGAKVGLLAVAVAAAVGLLVALGGGRDEAPPTPSMPPVHEQAPQAAPRSRRSTSVSSKPALEEDDSDAKPAPRQSTEFRLTGQVVDADAKPVADAVVRALRADGAATPETKSGADGRFSLRCGARPRSGAVSIGVSATSGPARAAFVAYDLMEAASDEDDIGDLQLEPAIPLTARVVDARGPVAGAAVYMGTFFGTVFAASTADQRGVARFDTTPATDAWLFAYAAGRGRARGEIPDQRDPAAPLVLTLARRTLRISVVETPGDAPIPGEEIGARIVTEADGSRLYSSFVPPVTVERTGADGTTRIEDVALDDGVEVRRTGADDAPVSAWRGPRRPTQPVVAPPRATEVQIDVPIGRTVRWRIAPGEVPSPSDGSLVKLRGTFGRAAPEGPAALKVEGADLVGVGFSTRSIDAFAEADDGSLAALAADSKSDRGADAVFKRPRRVDVSVHEEDDTPIVGAEVTLNLSAQGASLEGVQTDEKGLARFQGLASSLARVAVSVKSSPPADQRRAGVVDLSRGDGRVDVRLPRAREVVLRVTVDGRRGLPAEWKVLVDQTWQEGATGDAAVGEIRFSARPRRDDGSLHVLVRATGLRDAEFDVAAATSSIDVALDHGVTILADVRTTDGRPRGTLQRWTDDARWTDWRDRASVEVRRVEADGRRRFDTLPPGRWRLYDGASRTVGVAVDVALVDSPASLLLDLTRSGTVFGRVLGPDDKPVTGAWIDVLDAGASDIVGPGFAMRTYSVADGAFSLVVPGDRPIRLRVGHPLLRPDPEQGAVDVTEPRDGIVLRLVTGPIFEFVAPEMKAPLFFATGMIRLFKGAAEGEPAASLTPASTDGTHWSVGGFDPGRYTIWIDWRVGGAPVTLFDVDLKDGVTDVGEIRPPRGSCVRLRLVVPEGEAPPQVLASANRVDAPRYGRSAFSNGQAEVVVPGLGPGRFEVKAARQDGGGQVPGAWRIVKTVDLDGEHDVVIDYSPN